MSEISIYETNSGSIEVRLERETVWLSQEQMAALFDVQKAAVSKHLRNIFASGELERDSTVSKMETVQQEGKRRIARQIEHFNLDAVISVGYRVNSTRATRFRQWATRILREHLTQGYTISRQRFEANARELEAALQLVRKAARSPELQADMGRGLVDIVTRYAQTFVLLQRYDEGLLTEPPTTTGGTLFTVAEARAALAGLKADLIARGEASTLFAQERQEAFEALLGNLDQSVFGEPAYPSVESKAAHLLYFVIKNHPFADGNKRSGAFLFVDFLNRNGRLLDRTGQPVINDIGLAALALLVAESNPSHKDTMIRLIMNMLAQGT
ncbi:MAG: virulence protein RhuM/Fic/DOC family protein [Nitrospira sp.]|jgi:prophage maintenance system killer protein|uniref:virulence protein RhuM/Fic/DOC family protein n=1 Tax=Nitrospira sp. ND1 TaxID=1658518 RepID=UPI0009BA6CB2|nr:virulence protein RhuM/Fic/DOC family protein [Nitrospira sp. ND1]MBK7420703.1 virulence protein RhuM/Fic/DOC family protein [Nitrospira sp.]MBK7485766.1 virulence protein RhuM/Fic/DOC family protein [Nitrospira sp.]MBK9996279.1 virulence protein RhuM/Fic/DOC family protein [Nitrospira sp.]MBP8201431.1 virulence protein RhuM/Fic/DOC family protein [Nitrospira sp.]SLM42364.1 Death-on-curing family protein [Nitrospira sp. ND1]